LAGDIEGGELRDADAGDDSGGADTPGALTDLDDMSTTVGEEFDTIAAGDIARDDGEMGELIMNEADGISDAFTETVGGANGDDIDAPFDET